MKTFKVEIIDWDCLAPPNHYNLPLNTIIEAEDEDSVIDALSDKYGWCINSVGEIKEITCIEHEYKGNLIIEYPDGDFMATAIGIGGDITNQHCKSLEDAQQWLDDNGYSIE